MGQLIKVKKKKKPCLICHKLELVQLTFRTDHHIQPKCKGGRNNRKNLMHLCREHHDEIHGQGHYVDKRSKKVVQIYNEELARRGLSEWEIKSNGRIKY